MRDPAERVHARFLERVRAQDLPEPELDLSLADAGLRPAELADLFESQCMSRLLDITSRRLRKRDESYYTIGGSGHEGNVVAGKLFRITDMAFLHYRSGAMLIQRAKQRPGETPLYDMLLSFAASSEDPVSGGRHKVLGSATLMAPPQTSTIASHLPKAMGAAHAIGTARRARDVAATMPDDAVVLCNFGDASANHSTAQGAFNAACWASFQNSPMPIVFLCEDNGLGISVVTPKNWIAQAFNSRPGLKYYACDGLNLLEAHRVMREAAAYARRHSKPVFVHMRTVRLMGHAGSDAEISYRSAAAIEADERNDPLLHTARALIANNIMDSAAIATMYRDLDRRIARIAEIAIRRPKLRTAGEVMRTLAPPHHDRKPAPKLPPATRKRLFPGEGDVPAKAQPLARHINRALHETLARYPNAIVCGEDVAAKGGVYGVTQGLKKRFGAHRVIDTLLDEQSILGLALGLAHNGFLPIPEIQFLAYLHNAEDQIRGEAATLQFFSNGQFANPMVVRVAGLAYQKGFGGHFHNDNSLAVLRDIPGLVIACPSNGRDAADLLAACVDLAWTQRRVVIFLEPIALYMTRDLHASGDGGWASPLAPPAPVRPGEFSIHGSGTDLCIVTYGNGCYLSHQAAPILGSDLGIRIVDLRWLAPLDFAALARQAAACRHVLIIDECRHTGSISEALFTGLREHGVSAPMARYTALDSFIPLAAAANLVLPDVPGIVAAARELVTDAVHA